LTELLVITALGRCSADVKGYSGPSLTFSAADRTGSVSQSGKVRSLGENLKDKIGTLAPPKAEAGSVQAVMQVRTMFLNT
jgi:hypothetical protein